MKYDVIIIGGGLAGITAGKYLQENGRRTLVVSAGLSLHKTDRAAYVAAGGTILPGDSVMGGEFADDKLVCVRTANLGCTVLSADSFILCTGKFFSKGLASTMDTVYETVFGCDVDYEKDSTKWVVKDFDADQPFMSFGVVTDELSRVSIGGRTISNLYAAGEILPGKVNIEESALEVCRRLI